jgi:Ca2+-binding EF-hand superfamily protein
MYARSCSGDRMQCQLIIVIGAVALAVAVGCKRRDTPAPTTNAAPIVPSQSSAPEISTRKKEAEQKKAVQPISVEKPQPKPVQAAAKEVKKKAEVAAKKAERMAILAPGGPIAVDVFVTIDGRPLNEVFEDAVKQVLAAADMDKDGRSTWKELAENKKYPAGQQGQMPRGAGAQLKMWVEQYDSNRDGQIQHDEAASWLGRDTGISARAFDVRGSRSYGSVPSATSRIWRLLDVDENGRLSKSELARGAEKFFSLDENDDGIISPDELIPLREQLRVDRDPASTGSNATNAYAAIYLEPQYEVNRLDYLLGDLYGRGRVLSPASFPALAGTYKQLDTDGDDRLDQSELAGMRTMTPQLKLTVDFHQAGAKREASIVVVEHVHEIELVMQPAADRVVLKLGTTRIVVCALDRTSAQTPGTANMGSQIRMQVHDQCDALGEALDADADGRLGEREIATCAETLAKLDANGDGQITNDEIPYMMIAALVRGERPEEQSLYRPVLTTAPKAANVPSWFVSADYNGDGDVSRREFLGTTEQFSMLDTNHDGYISADEAAKQPAAPPR